MSLATGNSTLAKDIKTLKAKVKKEMLRRDGKGSLAAYGGSAYDYIVEPVANGKTLIEHANKIIVPMNAVKPSGFTEVKSGDPMKSLEALDAKVTAYAAESMTGNTSSCSSSCSGLCTTGSSGSSSCGSCTDACTAACQYSTDGSCTCGSACQGSTESSTCSNCKDGCTAYCGMSCYGNCSAQWNGGGAVDCGITCKNSCVGDVINNPV